MNHDMDQRKNTPSISTLQYCQHTREYLKEARTGEGTTGSVLGTSPFLTKTSTETGTRQTGAAANHEGRGQDTRDHPPSTQHRDGEQTSTQTDDQTEKQPPGQPGKFRWRYFRSFHPLSVVVLIGSWVVALDTPPHLDSQTN